MKAFSVRQPWAWLLVSGRADVHNIGRNTEHRGLTGVHAGETVDKDAERALRIRSPRIPFPNTFETGGMVGWVRVVDCVGASESEWFTGPFGLVLQDAHSYPLRPYRGAEGLFRVQFSPFGHAPCGCPLSKVPGSDVATVLHVDECRHMYDVPAKPATRRGR